VSNTKKLTIIERLLSEHLIDNKPISLNIDQDYIERSARIYSDDAKTLYLKAHICDDVDERLTSMENAFGATIREISKLSKEGAGKSDILGSDLWKLLIRISEQLCRLHKRIGTQHIAFHETFHKQLSEGNSSMICDAVRPNADTNKPSKSDMYDFPYGHLQGHNLFRTAV